MADKEDMLIREFLAEQPDIQFFYSIGLNFFDGSIGFSQHHSLTTDQQECRETIQQLCAQQKARWEQEVAEIQELPEDERPYDAALPDGCGVGLYVILPDRKQYVLMHGQSWHNNQQTHNPAHIPDIFDTAYYIDKAMRGEYRRYLVKSYQPAQKE